MEQLVRRPNGAQDGNVIPASSSKGDATRMITFTGETLTLDEGSEEPCHGYSKREIG